MNTIRGLAELASEIKETLPAKAPPRHEVDPLGVAAESLLVLHRLCREAHPSRIPVKIHEAAKQATALLGKAGVRL